MHVSTEARSLEYQVSPDGQVSTDGCYRIVSHADWEQLQAWSPRRRRKYAAVLEQIRAGHIVGIPVASNKEGWSVARELTRRASRQDTAIELKRGVDAQHPEQHIVMARRAPD